MILITPNGLERHVTPETGFSFKFDSKQPECGWMFCYKESKSPSVFIGYIKSREECLTLYETIRTALKRGDKVFRVISKPVSKPVSKP